MFKAYWFKMLFFTFLTGFVIANEENNTSDSKVTESSRVLSRKRRYLVFPDGSSFQLVFCAQNQGYLQIGDIVWFGNTAALAWELPTDPNIYQFFIKSEKKFLEGNRREDTKHVVYLDEEGRVLSKVPYRKKFIVNPAIVKRSVDTNKINGVRPISKTSMHEAHKTKNIIENLDQMSIRFHREGRKSLYSKIEKVLEGLGWSGKECLLRLLCETNKSKSAQGAFLEEIMRATFMFPRSASDHHEEYDMDHPADVDCERKFPECEDANGVLFDQKINDKDF